MALVSKGYCADSLSAYQLKEDWQLLFQNIGLILNNRQKILNTADYFFCQPLFASCSWPYLKNDGSLSLGYLLLGWQSNVLTEQCAECKGSALVTSFAGSPLSEGNSWTGICADCRQKQKGSQSKFFKQWMNYVLQLRQTFPATIKQIEEYDAFQFTWGGNGLAPTVKKRIVQVPVANPITLEGLINELQSGQIRSANPTNVHLFKQSIKLKPFSRH